MSKIFTCMMASLLLIFLVVGPAKAQGAAFDTTGLYTAAAGAQSNTSFKTGAVNGVSQAQVAAATSRQIPGVLPIVSTRGLTPVYGIRGYGPLLGLGYDVGYLSNTSGPNFNDTYAELANKAAVNAVSPDADGQGADFAPLIESSPYASETTGPAPDSHF